MKAGAPGAGSDNAASAALRTSNGLRAVLAAGWRKAGAVRGRDCANANTGLTNKAISRENLEKDNGKVDLMWASTRKYRLHRTG